MPIFEGATVSRLKPKCLTGVIGSKQSDVAAGRLVPSIAKEPCVWCLVACEGCNS